MCTAQRAHGSSRTGETTDVPIRLPTGIDVEEVDAFDPFREWVAALLSPDGLVGGEGATLSSITIRDVFRFGKRVGFLFLEADLSMPSLTGAPVKLPGAVLLRGTAVAVLMWSKDEDGVHVLVVR